MKNYIKSGLSMIAIVSLFVACNSSDPATTISGNGNLEVEFDNVFGSADLALNTPMNATSQGESLKISNVKYIISNIVLTKSDGTTFIYPKNQSYFIVDEVDETTHVLELNNIPAGNYTKIKFGIGVDQTQFDLGESGQGDLITLAQDADMFLNWTSGYKFMNLEGLFTSSTVTTDTAFIVETHKTTAAYNYNEVTLTMPESALIRTTITPEIHIFADVSKVIDGTRKIKLSENSTITDGDALAWVTTNLSEMFSVAHVHND